MKTVLAAIAGLGLLLSACGGNLPPPLQGFNRQLAQQGGQRSPALGERWLATIVQQGGREQVVLFDLAQQRPVPLSGLNRADALPISVSIDAAAERLALVRQRDGRSELVLYRRQVQSLQPIAMPDGSIPTSVSLRADGRQLAVQSSREGRWQIDLIAVP